MAGEGSVRRTRAARPDLLADAELDALEQAAYEEAVREGAGGAETPTAQDEGAKS